jgi:hypothetical protein
MSGEYLEFFLGMFVDLFGWLLLFCSSFSFLSKIDGICLTS